MAVINDFECRAHGKFESTEAICPYGCPKKWVQLVFLQPVGIRGAGTQRVDKELRNLSATYGMTDIRNGGDGSSVMSAMGRDGRAPKDGVAPQWLNIPHAPAGFSRDPNAKVPTVKPESFGTNHGKFFEPGQFGRPIAMADKKPRSDQAA